MCSDVQSGLRLSSSKVVSVYFSRIVSNLSPSEASRGDRIQLLEHWVRFAPNVSVFLFLSSLLGERFR